MGCQDAAGLAYIAEIAQLVGAILDGKAEAYPARLRPRGSLRPICLTTTVIETPVAVDVEGIGYT